jgi:hypothetical protein
MLLFVEVFNSTAIIAHMRYRQVFLRLGFFERVSFPF